MNISKIDLTKLIGFAIAVLGLLTASQLQKLFPHADTDTIQTISAWVGFIVLFLTLAYSTLKRPTPDDLHPVFSTSLQPMPNTVTTTALIEANRTGAAISDPTKPSGGKIVQ